MAAGTSLVTDALKLLGIENLVLAIHDACFPGLPDQDTGRGSPYSEGASRFFRFVSALGFNGIQFGPQGQTSDINASPYDGALFSRNILSIALHRLAEHPRWNGLLSANTLERWVRGRPEQSSSRTSYPYSFAAAHACLQEAYDVWRQRLASPTPPPGTLELQRELADFAREQAFWLERDGLHEALLVEHGKQAWTHWQLEGPSSLDDRLWNPSPAEEGAALARRAELSRKFARLMEEYTFRQFVAHAQHSSLRAEAKALGLKMYADLQIGFSVADTWAWHSLFLNGYKMGAPPSRTNPEGQPWGFPVPDPGQYRDSEAPGPVLRFLKTRMDKTFSEFDGVRIDHPHGLVCPWVYRSGAGDPFLAVQQGARLFCSPGLPDHPELAVFAIPRPDQINPAPGIRRYDDNWVTDLDPGQVERYAAMFDVLAASARENGRQKSDILAEVLSTMPYPLGKVLERHEIGRFRITQKADLANPVDVYRSENARPADWMMVGNHDTPSLISLTDRWLGTSTAQRQADYLADRLCPAGMEPARLAAQLAADRSALMRAKFADLFSCPARNVMVFFADLFGLRERYNEPGTVNSSNWMMRVPQDFPQEYAKRCRGGLAMDLPKVLAMALRSKKRGDADSRSLADRLEDSPAGLG